MEERINKKGTKYCIFTDLDGTLIESSVVPKKIISFVNVLKKRNIPLIFCSVRTSKEQKYFRTQLDIHDPFIVENGSAVYIPENYFLFDHDYTKKEDRYEIVELGVPYKKIKKIISSISQDIGIELKGFEEADANEIAMRMKVPVKLAEKAQKRAYSEVIVSWNPKEKMPLFLRKIEKEKLSWIYGGRFYTIGGNKKGEAVPFLSSLYKKMENVVTVGIGNSENDLSLLRAVNIPFLVQKLGGKWAFHEQGIHMVKGIGSEGWIQAVKAILSLQGGLQ